MKKQNLFFAIILLFVGFSSCGDDKKTTEETSQPEKSCFYSLINAAIAFHKVFKLWDNVTDPSFGSNINYTNMNKHYNYFKTIF